MKSSILKKSIFAIILLYTGAIFSQQKVGLVLSGGGAAGLAHIGVLKALEERGIPIDCITGTSAGAFVGAMYSAGYSPEEIEQYVLTEDFQLMFSGKQKPSQRFLLREEEATASLINLLFTPKNILTKSLPTNFVSSAFLDFEMLKTLGTASSSYHNDFDSLFVPFRCVSSDITKKESVVFSKGNLNQAVRSSLSYPFYFSPLRVNDALLFDGGLYNNFPADVMYNSFNPDFIIGSNVSYNAEPPSEDNVISQITNMLVKHTDFNLPCDDGIIIQPKTDVTTFEFEDVSQAINDGYTSTLKYLDSIEIRITHTISKEELSIKRARFRSKIIPMNIENITTSSYKKIKLNYIEKSMLNSNREKRITSQQFEKRYFRTYTADQVNFIFPTLTKITDSSYNVNLDVRNSKEFKLDVGGHFSSRAVNTGYLGVSYRFLGKTAGNLKAESYFGKFYGSIKTEVKIEIPSIYPISVSGYFTMNKWDYFQNFATFFEDNKPSFLIQNEIYWGAKLAHPIGNTAKSTFDLRGFSLEDDYYQDPDFTNKDTTDKTYFTGSAISWQFLKNSLNRKQFASSGHYFSFKVRYVNGKERSISGTAYNNAPYDTTLQHQWLNINTEFQTFIINNPYFHLGIHAKGILNTQALFSNYTATMLALTSFSPIPDAETYFLPEYRSPQYVGAGLNTIYSLRKKIDIRFDAYFYQPFVRLNVYDDGSFGYSKPFKGQSVMASASLIYHSFFGPLRATIDFFPQQIKPIALQISYGYTIFNDKAIR